MFIRVAPLAAALCAISTPSLAEDVKVDGADVRYPSSIELEGSKLRLTGTGLRKKFVFNVYTVASYVAKDAEAKSATSLAALDDHKRLHLVMERGVDGKTMAEAFKDAIKKNHNPTKIQGQIDKMSGYLNASKAEDKHHIMFDHIPGKGVRIERTGQKPIMIEGLDFARAIWDIYLGKENISGDIKKGLTKKL